MFFPEDWALTANLIAVIPIAAYTTTLTAELTRLTVRLGSSRLRCPQMASNNCQIAMNSRPIPIIHSSASPYDSWASCWSAPCWSGLPERSPNASCSASQPISRWTMP